MSVTYAGVPLMLPTKAMCAWVEESISPAEVYQFTQRSWPGKNLTRLTFPYFQPLRPIKVGSLYWPHGAARWAVGHFMATTEQWDAIREQVYTTDGLVAQTLQIMSNHPASPDASDFITAQMFALPARPISLADNSPPPLTGAHLLTLVDDRYYWWFVSTGQLAITTGMSWPELYQALADRLDIDLTIDGIDADYLMPDPDSFNLGYEPLPLVLDAVAFNVGQRIVRTLSGTVRAMDYQLGATRGALGKLVQNLTDEAPWRIAGGEFGFAEDAPAL